MPQRPHAGLPWRRDAISKQPAIASMAGRAAGLLANERAAELYLGHVAPDERFAKKVPFFEV